MEEVIQKSLTKKIPTTIFSGFLGSGKTTIILNLVDALQSAGEQVVYIKNEVGDTDIDSKMLAETGIKTTELLNGCICCTLVGPFINAATEIIEKYSPDRLIIEASGAADPSALALMVSSHPMLQRDGVITVIDVVNFEGYKDLSITSQAQTQFTDLIIFNKVEEVDLNRKKAVVGYVRELNSHSPIIEAPNGKVAPDLIFGLDEKFLDQILKRNHVKNNEKHSHIEEDNINSITIQNTKVYKQTEFVDKIASLPKNVIRAKGIVKFEDNKFYIFNAVAGKTNLKIYEPKEMPKENLMVFIGISIEDSFSNDL